MVNENYYQAKLTQTLKKRFPGCIVTKGKASQMQGIPDLCVQMPGIPFYAMLECKRSSTDPHRPNQDYYIDMYKQWGVYASFVYPENEKEVLDGLAQAYEAARTACDSKS